MEAISDARIGPRSVRGSHKKAARTWFPLLGVGATIIGTIAAINSIPDDPQPRGALFWPALCLGLGLLTAPLIGLRKQITSALRTENLLMVGLVYWLLLDLLQGAYPLTGIYYDDVVLAFTAVGLMAAGIWIGTLGVGWPLPNLVVRVMEEPLSNDGLFLALWASFLLGVFYYAYSSDFDPAVMIAGLGACRFCAPWARGALGGSDAFIEHLKYFGYSLPALTVLIAHRDGWVRPRAILGIIMSIVIIAFLVQEGGRRVVGVVVGSGLLTWMLLQGRITGKMVIGGFVAIVIVLFGLEQILHYRSQGFAQSNSSLQSLQPSLDDAVDGAVVHVDDNFFRLSQMVRLFPDVQSYVDFQPLFYAAVMPVPRVLWPGKPTDVGYDLAKLLSAKGVSLTQSIIGELYAMHGLLVVFIGGFVYGRMANMWNKILAMRGNVGKPMIYGLGAMVLFVGLRSLVDLVIMSYGVLGWLVLAKLLPRAKSGTVAKPG